MRKWISVVFIFAVVGMAGVGLAAPSLDDQLISKAKTALSLISYGEYDRAVQELGFSIDSSEFEDFALNDLSDLMYVSVQMDVAVAYYSGQRWIIAVPIEDPDYDSVQVFALSSSEGTYFDGYRALTWGDVLTGVGKADQVIWKDAYDPGMPSLIADY